MKNYNNTKVKKTAIAFLKYTDTLPIKFFAPYTT